MNIEEIFSNEGKAIAQAAGDVQCTLLKQEPNDIMIFILVNTNNHIHITVDMKNINKTVQPTNYSSYEFLKIRNPSVDVYQTQLIEKDRFGKDKKIEQYFLVNSRYQIQLVYPQYPDNSEKFKITDMIKEKYKIEYILDNDMMMKVFQRSHSDKGILRYNSDLNCIRQKYNLMRQLNLDP